MDHKLKTHESQALIEPNTYSIRQPIPAKSVTTEEFLSLFGDVKCFRTFAEKKSKGGNTGRNFTGSFESIKAGLRRDNDAGRGVFFIPNSGGHSAGAITKINAIFLDLDGNPLKPILDTGLSPHAIIESSPGRFHVYFCVDGLPVERFTPIQKALIKFGNDKQVHDLCRVMRLPGFNHCKGEPVETRVIEFNPDLPKYSEQELIEGLELGDPIPETKPESNNNDSRDVLTCLANGEVGDADLFAKIHQRNFLYDHAADDWYSWTGHQWQLDEIATIYEGVTSVANAYHNEAIKQGAMRVQASQEGRQEKATQHARLEMALNRRTKNLHTLSRQRNVIFLAARGDDKLGISGREWDLKPWLLPVKNGVIDLQTGKLRPGEHRDHIKTVAPHEWKGIDAPAPTWEKFINDIIVTEQFESDPETVSYLHKLLGYSVTGMSNEHVFPILWGDRGRNGKSTMLETLRFVLGGLAAKIPSETLLQSRNTQGAGAPSPHMLAFRGKRLCFASETDQNRRLNVTLVKELAGGDTITARGVYSKRQVEFEPTHKIFLTTNNRPRIPGKTIDPIWERIALIPFHLKYVDFREVSEPFERPRDKNLSLKLKNEASGILAWLVRGCMAWQKDGLLKSASVKAATAEYHEAEDVIGQFISDKCRTSHGLSIKASDLFKAYSAWCAEQNLYPVNQTVFGRDVGQRFDSHGAKQHKAYQGIDVTT